MKSTLEAREVTKLHDRDLTFSNDEFSSYAQSIKLISTSSMLPLINNEPLDLYSEGVTLSKLIHEERLTSTKRLSLLFEPSDEPIRRLYGLPGEENYISDTLKSRSTSVFNFKSIGRIFPKIQASNGGLKIHPTI